MTGCQPAHYSSCVSLVAQVLADLMIFASAPRFLVLPTPIAWAVLSDVRDDDYVNEVVRISYYHAGYRLYVVCLTHTPKTTWCETASLTWRSVRASR